MKKMFVILAVTAVTALAAGAERFTDVLLSPVLTPVRYSGFESKDGVHFALASEPGAWSFLDAGYDIDTDVFLALRGAEGEVKFGLAEEGVHEMKLGETLHFVENAPGAFRLPGYLFEFTDGRPEASVALLFDMDTKELRVREGLEHVQANYTVSAESGSTLHVIGPVEFKFDTDIFWNDFWLMTKEMIDGGSGFGDDRVTYNYCLNAGIEGGKNFAVFPYSESRGMVPGDDYVTGLPNNVLVDSQYRVIDVDLSGFKWNVEPLTMISSLTTANAVSIEEGETKQLEATPVFIEGVDTAGFRLIWGLSDEWWRQNASVTIDGELTGNFIGESAVRVLANDASGLFAEVQVTVTEKSGVQEVADKKLPGVEINGHSVTIYEEAASSEIYTIDGKLVWTGCGRVELPTGIYILSSRGGTMKVRV